MENSQPRKLYSRSNFSLINFIRTINGPLLPKNMSWIKKAISKVHSSEAYYHGQYSREIAARSAH